MTTTVAFTATALGTTTRAVVTRPDALPAVAALMRTALRALDEAASRFRPDSELSRANAAAGAPLRVGPVLRDVTQACLRMAEATGGLVDPLVGRAVIAAGYDRRFAEIDPRTVRPLRPVPSTRADWRDVDLRAEPEGAWLTVPPGALLDLGAIAKAWLADTLATVTSSVVRGGVLIDLGGDVRVAGEPPRGGWVIGVPSAADGQRMVVIESGGIATSSRQSRRWRTADGTAHHIIDPRTGRPADGPWGEATVHAATAVEANAASTAAVVLGERAQGWLAEQGLSARLVGVETAQTTLTGSWPRPDRAVA